MAHTTLVIRHCDMAEYNISYMRYKNLDEATQALLLYAPAATIRVYTLETMHQLMAAVGNPHTRLRVIHVAGTSGKTSTCYYIRALLESSGCRTGLTVSPHITEINERVQIDGEPLEEARFVQYLETFMSLVEATTLSPSYYELTIAFAYYVFDQEHVDYAIIETGLGGLLDSSNVAMRDDKVCVIQRIGYDHTEILGDTIEEIALQKAGIIHENNEVFVMEQPEPALTAIVSYARMKHTEVNIVEDTHDADIAVTYQQANWSLGLAVYKFIVSRDHIQMANNLQLARAKTQFPPGRFEVSVYKGKTVILDGAHNEQKLTALFDSLPASSLNKPIIIFSLRENRDQKIAEYLQIIKDHCSQIVLTTFAVGQDARSIKSVDPEVVKRHADEIGILATIITNQQDAFSFALSQEYDTILITGSLYLVSEMRKLIVD